MTRVPSFAVDAVAFDLDGTLLDTIHDLAAAVNRLLAERGLPVLPKAMIRDFVGKGMANLLTRALAKAGAPVGGAEELAPILARYQEWRAETFRDGEGAGAAASRRSVVERPGPVGGAAGAAT